jgi:hypothetical protein
LVSAVPEWAVSEIVIRKVVVPIAADGKVSNGEASTAAVSAAVVPGAVSHVRRATADVASGPPAVVTAPKVGPIAIKLRTTARAAGPLANAPIMPVDRATIPSMVVRIAAVRIVAAQNAVDRVAIVEVPEALLDPAEIGPIATSGAMQPAQRISCSRSCSKLLTARLLNLDCPFEGAGCRRGPGAFLI